MLKLYKLFFYILLAFKGYKGVRLAYPPYDQFINCSADYLLEDFFL